jgi:hypothetical protein
MAEGTLTINFEILEPFKLREREIFDQVKSLEWFEFLYNQIKSLEE